MAGKRENTAPDDSAPLDTNFAQRCLEDGFSREAGAPEQSDDPPSTSYSAADRATLLRKFTVHATSSRRLQGLADAGLMLLALLPTVILRLIRAAMGLLGITEHRWRGISMIVPLTPEDRAQLEVLAHNLVAGRLGRRPEPPRRGPVPPAQQLLLDTHSILAAAAATATAFSLPYSGMPEAALQAKLSSYLRSVAPAEGVCTQDCLKPMRKMARKTLTALCAAAPRLPSPETLASRGSGGVLSALRSFSSTRMVSRPARRAVAKAFMAACLLEQSRSQPETLVQLVARLPDGAGDLVETVSLISLAPGAEYLRLLGAAAGDPQRFSEQLEAAAEFGRLRPSDAKKDPAMQGLAINARVHGVGVVRYPALASAGASAGVKGGGTAAAGPNVGSRLNGGAGPYGQVQRGQQGDGSRLRPRQPLRPAEDGRTDEVRATGPEVGEDAYKSGNLGGSGAGLAAATAAAAVAEATIFASPSPRPAWGEDEDGDVSSSRRRGGAAGPVATEEDGDDVTGGQNSERGGDGPERRAASEGASVGSESDGGDMEGLLSRDRKHHGAATSSQPDLKALAADPDEQPPGGATPAAAPPPPPPMTGSKKTLALALGLAAAVSKRALGLLSQSSVKKSAAAAEQQSAAAAAAAAAYAAARAGGAGGRAAAVQLDHLRAKAPSFTAASGPSTNIILYPTAALDVFQSLYACPRSGAFAVHGRSPRGVGLSRLSACYSACHALPAPEQSALLRRLGCDSLEALRQEVELRRALCVAQALPVVAASLRLMCRSAACLRAAARCGSFLHVQQSLLSDLHRHERGYLEDTRGALDALAERLVVRFVEGSEKVLPLNLSGGHVVVSLPVDCVSAAALAEAGLSTAAFCGATYGLTALLFNQGINSLQSLGFLSCLGAAEPLQDSLNRHSLERLNEYAQRAGQAGGPHLAALNRHYSPEGRRPPKDTAMFSLVRRAVEEVGGGRAVNCKSGKDRTALEVSKALAAEVVAAGLLPASETCWLEGQFLRGLSYITTSQNHGQPPAYAFNEMEIATLPTGWRPDWRLCGKVAS